PSELVDTARGSLAELGETRRYEPDPEYSYSPEEFVRRVRGGPPQRQQYGSRFSSSGSSSRRPPRFGFSRAPPANKRPGAGDPLMGRKVRPPEFGVGTIIAIEGDDDDRRLSVTFPGRGTKKFVERYAQLEQV